MADAAAAAAPPTRVCVPRFLLRITARQADTRCRLCGADNAVGDDISTLANNLRDCAPLAAQLAAYPSVGWSHTACWATARAWRARAGLERPPAAWDAPGAALTADERRAAEALAAGEPELTVPRAQSPAFCGAAFWSPSPHQVALYREVLEGTGHIVVDAKAGSGKTSSLAAALTLMGWSSGYAGASFAAMSEAPLLLAFNRHNMADLVAAVPRDAAEVHTFHSLGLSLWNWLARGGCVPRVIIVSNKTVRLLQALLPDVRAPGGKTVRDRRYTLLKPFVVLVVSLAKCWALGCVGAAAAHTHDGWQALVSHFGRTLTRLLSAAVDKQPAGEPQARRYTLAELLDMGLALARSVYSESLVAALCRGEWDFDDMILAPLAFDDAALRAAVGVPPPAGETEAFAWHPRSWVLVDEAQDLNPARRLMLRRLLRPGGRLLAVGDPAQALYGFTGAHAGGLASLATELAATRLSLPVCYRCPASHVAAAAALLGAHEGALVARPGAPAGRIEACAARIALDGLGPSGAAVLCRGNAELLQLYLALLRRGAPCRLVGVAAVNGALHALLQAALRKRVAPGARASLAAPQLADAIRAHAAAKRARRDAAATAAGSATGAGDASKADADDHAQCLLALLAETQERAVEAPLAGAALLDALRAMLDQCYKPGAKDRKPWQDDAADEDLQAHSDDGDGAGSSTPPPSHYTPRHGELVLCTVHKAKGREWDVVYLLQPGKMAGAHAAVAAVLAAADEADGDAEVSEELLRLRREGASWEATAERNVTYVALTRARRTLTLLADSDDPWCFDARALLPPPPLPTPAAMTARTALEAPAPPAKRLLDAPASSEEDEAGGAGGSDEDGDADEEGPASTEMRRTSPVAPRDDGGPSAKRRLL
jgi:hypothetical protein